MTRDFSFLSVAVVAALCFVLIVTLWRVSDLQHHVHRLEQTRLICHPVVGSVSDRVCVSPK